MTTEPCPGAIDFIGAQLLSWADLRRLGGNDRCPPTPGVATAWRHAQEFDPCRYVDHSYGPLICGRQYRRFLHDEDTE